MHVLEMTVTRPPVIGSGQSTEIAIRPMRPDDSAAVVAFMKGFPEVHFCDWETPDLLARAVRRQRPKASFVARRTDGRVVGAIIAGSVGVRGTISHLAVDPQARRAGIGAALVERTLAAFRNGGLRRVFLFVVDDALSGHRFWASMGFRATSGETTLEVDL